MFKEESAFYFMKKKNCTNFMDIIIVKVIKNRKSISGFCSTDLIKTGLYTICNVLFQH